MGGLRGGSADGVRSGRFGSRLGPEAKSSQIKSNQVKSSQAKSSQIKTAHHLVPRPGTIGSTKKRPAGAFCSTVRPVVVRPSAIG